MLVLAAHGPSHRQISWLFRGFSAGARGRSLVVSQHSLGQRRPVFLGEQCTALSVADLWTGPANAAVGSCDAARVDSTYISSTGRGRSLAKLGYCHPEEPSLMCVRGAQQEFVGVSGVLGAKPIRGFAVSNQKGESERFLALNTRHLRREKFGSAVWDNLPSFQLGLNLAFSDKVNLKRHVVRKNGKQHVYYSLSETIRINRNRTVQRRG